MAQIIDHLGNPFISVKAMCVFYNINRSSYDRRRKQGWSLEKSLITEIREHKELTFTNREVQDFNGRTFSSTTAMCQHYQIKLPTYLHRIKQGFSLKEALTYKIRSGEFIDHLGKVWPTKDDCADFYGINRGTFRDRLTNMGYTPREAIVTPLFIKDKHNISEVSDTSLNPLIIIHEYSHTQAWTGQRVFRCTLLLSNKELYLTEEQVKTFRGVL